MINRSNYQWHSRILMMIFCFTVKAVSAQVQDSLAARMNNYSKNAIQEKVYVHTDKKYYQSGEIVWFRVDVVDGYFHQPLDISKQAYAEIIDAENKPVFQARVGLKKGYGNGSFAVSRSVRSGVYKLRAYTNWMKNFSADFYFEKEITIINAGDAYQAPPAAPVMKYDIQFFPEGGNLVKNIESRVGFRVVDINGKGVNCSGVVIGGKSDTSAVFNTQHSGLGSFMFTPSAEQTYKAVITLPGQITITRDLPVAYENGYAMQLNRSGNNIKISVRSPSDGTVYILAHTRGVVKSAKLISLNNGKGEFNMDLADLGEGISHFTVFDSNKKPVCERLYFKYPERKLQLNLLTDAQTYTTRKKIEIDLASLNENDQLVAADMSMTIYKLDSLLSTDENDISSYMWLNSDLAGNVESPGYYFRNNDTLTLRAMDNLMLTQGWRRFKWEDVDQLSAPKYAFAPECNGHLVTGRIYDNRTNLPAKGVAGYLSIPGNNTFFQSGYSDSNGVIKFELKDFFGENELIVQTNSLKDSNYRIDVINPFSRKYSSGVFSQFILPEKNPLTILDQSISAQVQYVYTSDRQNKFNTVPPDTVPFYGRDNISVYKLDEYVRFTTMEEVLREYVRPVGIANRGGAFSAYVYNDFNRTAFSNDPLVLLDGVPIFKMSKLISYDPLKVRTIEVLPRRYFRGDAIFDGIINVHTINGDINGYELDANALVVDYEGLQMEREFFSPIYKTTEQQASRLPDFRNVLQWMPSIKTDASGKQRVELYSSDLKGKYAIVVQGITADGRTGSATSFIEIGDPVIRNQ